MFTTWMELYFTVMTGKVRVLYDVSLFGIWFTESLKGSFSTSVRVEGFELKNILDYAKPNQLFKAKETFTNPVMAR